VAQRSAAAGVNFKRISAEVCKDVRMFRHIPSSLAKCMISPRRFDIDDFSELVDYQMTEII
jgi:hypothetical protein